MANPKKRFSCSEKKLKELVLFISSECKDSPEFGKTVLYKILFYSDFYSYLYLGKPISGAVYVKRKHGPAPKEILKVLDTMEDKDQTLRFEYRERFGKTQQRPVNRREPNLKAFSPREIDITKQVIAWVSGLNAVQISELSHKELAWKVAEENQEIPYESFLIREIHPVPPSTIKWAQEVARKSRFRETSA